MFSQHTLKDYASAYYSGATINVPMFRKILMGFRMKTDVLKKTAIPMVFRTRLIVVLTKKKPLTGLKMMMAAPILITIKMACLTA